MSSIENESRCGSLSMVLGFQHTVDRMNDVDLPEKLSRAEHELQH